jgi:hypothetical protein
MMAEIRTGDRVRHRDRLWCVGTVVEIRPPAPRRRLVKIALEGHNTGRFEVVYEDRLQRIQDEPGGED